MGIFDQLLVRIAKALESANISYMIIGGQAVLVHGRPRFTGDIDVTLGVDVDNLPKLRTIAKELSLEEITKDVERLVKQTNVFPVKDPATRIKVDFLFSFSPYEREAIKRAQPIELEGTKVFYASAEDTIIHKMVAGRPIDLSDIKSIVNIKPDIDKSYILKWLKVYTEVVGRNLVKEYQEIEKQVSQSKGKQ